MEKGIRSMLVNLLVSLKGIYTFRELETVTGVPQNNLWKYVSLSMVPEEPTAKKIYGEIRSKKVIEKAVASMIQYIRMGEEWRSYWRIGYCDLAGFLLYEKLQFLKPNAIVVYPEKIMGIGMPLLRLLKKRLCVASSNKLCRSRVYVVEHFIDGHGYPSLIYLPRTCPPKGSETVVLVENPDKQVVEALNRLIHYRLQERIIAIITILGSTSDLHEVLKPGNPKILSLEQIVGFNQ